MSPRRRAVLSDAGREKLRATGQAHGGFRDMAKVLETKEARRAERAFAGTVSRETSDPIAAFAGRHYITAISYRDERVGCSCGVIITAKPDHPAVHDRHQPLVDAWEQHRREAGVNLGRRRIDAA